MVLISIKFLLCFTSVSASNTNMTVLTRPIGPSITGADPEFCVRGDESRRGVWGPLKVSSGSRAEPPGSSWALNI